MEKLYKACGYVKWVRKRVKGTSQFECTFNSSHEYRYDMAKMLFIDDVMKSHSNSFIYKVKVHYCLPIEDN